MLETHTLDTPDPSSYSIIELALQIFHSEICFTSHRQLQYTLVKMLEKESVLRIDKL